MCQISVNIRIDFLFFCMRALCFKEGETQLKLEPEEKIVNLLFVVTGDKVTRVRGQVP